MPRHIGIITLVVVIGAVATPSIVRADYAQVSCDVDNESDSAIIWVDDASRVEKHPALNFNVEFFPSGVAVRLPPQFYAPDWTQVENIEMQYPDRESKLGLLQLRIHNIGGSMFIQTVGRVERSCWNAVKKYIRQHVESKGTTVHVSETIAK